MRGNCGRGGGGRQALGVILMLAGALIFLFFVPRWVWAGALGILCISIGFLLWRFGG